MANTPFVQVVSLKSEFPSRQLVPTVLPAWSKASTTLLAEIARKQGLISVLENPVSPQPRWVSRQGPLQAFPSNDARIPITDG
jgi:hypothetical protein